MKLLIVAMILAPGLGFATNLPVPANFTAGTYHARHKHGNCYDGELKLEKIKGETLVVLNENNRVSLKEDLRFPAMEMENCTEHTHTLVINDGDSSTVISTMAYDCAGKAPEQISDEKWTFTADQLIIESKPDAYTKRSTCVLDRVP